MPPLHYTPQSIRSGSRLGWRDLVLFIALFGLIAGCLHLARQMHAPFTPGEVMTIDLSPARLPEYAARSLVRMFLAFGASILFTLVYGYIAAHSRRAERVLIPLLDILQSVPVLGFLSVTVTGFMALFPGSLLGLECACIFAVFTGQAWNMTFSFYQSLKTIPDELKDASLVYRLTWWQRFTRLEVPFSMIGLVWNGMMSFGGGWFFLSASEAISVLNQNYKLEGIGSYMAGAVDKGDARAIAWSIVTMVTVVVVVDQLFWRPVVAWSKRFRFEEMGTEDEPESFVLDLLRRSSLVAWVQKKVLNPGSKALDRFFMGSERFVSRAKVPGLIGRVAGGLAALMVGGMVVYGLTIALRAIQSELTGRMVFDVLEQGILTLLRVLVVVILATLIWTPIGVRIGFSRRLAKIAQPLVQIGASFPANLIFPVVVIAFIHFHISLNWGSILLLALGTQWYILFNVIAGASAVPSDLREAAMVFHLGGWRLWRKLILPAIFPAWVTGALTASGGAWNASIVAEVASWGSHKLTARGLGAYIAQATERGDWPQIILGISTMCFFVIVLNRLVWRRLYALGEERYRLG